MQIKPILSALTRHRIAAVLIALEIALACAVLCNAFFLISARLDLLHLDSGVDEKALATVALSGCDACGSHTELNARVLDVVRGTPGIQAVGTINSLPFTSPAGNSGVCLDQQCNHVGGVPHFYTADAGAMAALRLTPVRGRSFSDEDYQSFERFAPNAANVLITRALAEHLWPEQDPLGKELWGAGHYRVIGILEHLARPDPGRSEDGMIGTDWSVVVPVRNDSQSGVYVLRADPKELPRLLQQVRARITQAIPQTLLDDRYSQPLSELRQTYFRPDRAMAGLLVAVIAAMLLVTALGIVGLASFWVAQRTKQIGIRRALGATRKDILRYFQTENFLLASGGIVLGMLLAYGGNLLLMKYFELARLPLRYLPIGAVLLWGVGQLAVLGPALRAASIPPVVATRAV